MYNKRSWKRAAAFALAAVMACSVCVTDITSEAAAKAVKKVDLKIGKKKVTKKTYTLKAGKTAKITVAVTPAKAKKSVSFKSGKKAVASVSKSGKVTAKKTGTAKITVTVTGKNKKKKSTWLKIKVTKKVAPDPVESKEPVKTPEPSAEPTPEPTPFKPIDITSDTNPIAVSDAEGNPVYGGDPSILVDGDTVYLYVGHDVSKAESYNIPEYCVYSTKDLKNWTYHGPVLNMKDVSWGANDAAWAGQVMKYNNKYYMYFCSWNSKDSGKQSIGVAVSDSPTGPFVDKGEALVKGSVTTAETSTWNDIDPTAWIETDENGTEHRYLAWGNGKYYGKYYLFYAHGWREQMAYTTTDNLLDGKWDDNGNVVMEPSVTSNTNHMAVFDFKGKTYFVYHNGSMPAGSGFRRIPCITEIKFEEDGSILAIPETAAGINGKTSQIYVSGGIALAHEHFVNSGADGEYPYTKVDVGLYLNPEAADAQWVITSGKADRTNKEYVSIQSENKPGLYLTANDDKTVTLAQDHNLNAIAETAKKQTFIQKAGLADASMVSFESVSQPGMYITLVGRTLALTDGSDKTAATFSIDKETAAPSDAKTENSFTSLKVDGKDVDVATKEHNLEVELSKEEILVEPALADKDGYYTLEWIDANGNPLNSPEILLGSADLSSEVSLEGEETRIRLTAYAENLNAVQTIVVTIKTKDASDFTLGENLVKSFDFEDKTDDATAVTKAAVPAPVVGPEYKYAEGKSGKGIVLDGTYGLKLADSKDLNLGENYTISFWMKPDVLGGAVDPTLTAGTFSPEHWLNLTFDAKIWSRSGDYIATTAANAYKAGEWQHVAVCVNGDKAGTAKNTGTARLYINGKLVSSGDIAKGIMTTENSAIYFGVNAWDAYFKGTLDDVKIINRYLAQKEVQVLAKGDAVK